LLPSGSVDRFERGCWFDRSCRPEGVANGVAKLEADFYRRVLRIVGLLWPGASPSSHDFWHFTDFGACRVVGDNYWIRVWRDAVNEHGFA
jgi:hypothetical protein